MAFEAEWRLTGLYRDSASDFPSFYIEGATRKYLIDWGDGSTSLAEGQDSDGDGIREIKGPYHQYADGTYLVSISQGGRGRPVEDWSVLMARTATGDLDLTGSTRSDFVLAGSGNDRIAGGVGNDFLIGADGDDRLVGGSPAMRREDNDSLFGGFGDDVLVGGAGRDRLTGGNGVDRLRGGDDADTFASVRPETADKTGTLLRDSDVDTILDFRQGEDLIDLSDWSGRRLLTFIGQDAFGAARNVGEVRFEFSPAGDTIVSGDANGDGTIDFRSFCLAMSRSLPMSLSSEYRRRARPGSSRRRCGGGSRCGR